MTQLGLTCLKTEFKDLKDIRASCKIAARCGCIGIDYYHYPLTITDSDIPVFAVCWTNNLLMNPVQTLKPSPPNHQAVPSYQAVFK